MLGCQSEHLNISARERQPASPKSEMASSILDSSAPRFCAWKGLGEESIWMSSHFPIASHCNLTLIAPSWRQEHSEPDKEDMATYPIPISEDCPFGLYNLPFGIFSTPEGVGLGVSSCATVPFPIPRASIVDPSLDHLGTTTSWSGHWRLCSRTPSRGEIRLAGSSLRDLQESGSCVPRGKQDPVYNLGRV